MNHRDKSGLRNTDGTYPFEGEWVPGEGIITQRERAASHFESRASIRLDIRAVFWSIAFVAAASHAACALFVAIAPKLAADLFSFIFHADLTRLARAVTWTRFFGGGLLFSLAAALLASLGAWSYNRLVGAWPKVGPAESRP